MIVRDFVAHFHDLRMRNYQEHIVSKALLVQQGTVTAEREDFCSSTSCSGLLR